MIFESLHSSANAAIRLVKIDRLQKPTGATLVHFTSRKPSVNFVQGAFVELLINSDLSFRLKLVTVRAEKSCELFTVWEGCFHSDANWFWRELFFSAVPHSD